jgi:hypothetical protein
VSTGGTAGDDAAAPDASGTTETGVAHAVSYTFDTGLGGWFLNTYSEPPNLVANPPDGGAAPIASFDGTVGNPDPGSLKVTATFTSYNHYVDPIINFTAVNASGKTLHAKAMLASGAFMGFAVLHASTGAYVYGAGTYVGLTAGAWTDLTFDLSTITSAGWDPTMLVQVGVQFGYGNPPTGANQDFDTPVDAVFYVDTVTD